MSAYVIHLATMTCIYAILVYSLNLTSGYGGMLLFCQAAFYGIGAYVCAILQLGGNRSVSRDLLLCADLPFAIAFPAAMVAAGMTAVLVGLIALKFRGDFFIFITIAAQTVIFLVLNNADRLTRGSFGLPGIPRPEIFGWHASGNTQFLALGMTVTGVILLLLLRLYRSPFGRSLLALRDNEVAAESLGVSAFRQRLWSLAISGTLAGAAGALYASYISFIDPTSFALSESILLVCMLLLGGAGNGRGPILGVAVFLLLPEGLRFTGLSQTGVPAIRDVLIGVILVVLMIWRVKGLAGERVVG